MTQPDLFDQPQTDAYARGDDPQTSHEAAKSIQTTDLESLVYAELRRAPGSSFQLAERMDLSLVTVSPRVAPLVRKGLVKDSGQREVGQNGRRRTIWEAIQVTAA